MCVRRLSNTKSHEEQDPAAAQENDREHALGLHFQFLVQSGVCDHVNPCVTTTGTLSPVERDILSSYIDHEYGEESLIHTVITSDRTYIEAPGTTNQ